MGLRWLTQLQKERCMFIKEMSFVYMQFWSIAECTRAIKGKRELFWMKVSELNYGNVMPRRLLVQNFVGEITCIHILIHVHVWLSCSSKSVSVYFSSSHLSVIHYKSSFSESVQTTEVSFGSRILCGSTNIGDFFQRLKLRLKLQRINKWTAIFWLAKR